MALYPSLEDMKVGQMIQAQAAQQQAPQPIPFAPAPVGYATFPYAQTGGPVPAPVMVAPNAPPSHDLQRAYPALFDMGLNLTPEEISMITENQVAVRAPAHVAVPHAAPAMPGTLGGALVAPLSGGSLGLARAEVTHGIREITLCKDGKGKCGFRVQAVSKGVFVVLVQKDSAASLVGLRFGDQILQIDGENVAGFSIDKVHTMIKKGPVNGIRLAVRDRPFERTITMHKDTANTVGFVYKQGRINAVVKDSSAARNGVITDHHLLEVNGQNVVGLKDSDTKAIIDAGGNIITITIMPSIIYEYLVKNMAGSVVKKLMDHTIPD